MKCQIYRCLIYKEPIEKHKDNILHGTDNDMELKLQLSIVI